MRLTTLDILRCPECGGPLEVAARRAVSSAGRLREGLLGCRCGTTYPVIGWVPRMFADSGLTPAERSIKEELSRGAGRTAATWPGRSGGSAAPGTTAVSSEDSGGAIGPTSSGSNGDPAPLDVVDEQWLGGGDYRARIESMVRSKILYRELPPKLLARAERDIEYRIEHTDRKDKFVKTAESFLTTPPRSILDLGGGQGGALTAFRKEFGADRSVLLDIDDEWVELAWLRDPETEVVRGDATRMPFREGSFDLLFTQATLEHIADWKTAVAEMCRVSEEGLLCYNPNGRFPYDMGHLDAPFVTWLPKGPAAHVARAYHLLRRTGRSMESIRGELAVTHYRPRAAVVRELRRLGCTVENAFGEFLRHSAEDPYHLYGGRLMRTFRAQPWTRAAFVQALLLTGAEPNVYLYYRGPDRGSGSVGTHRRAK